MSFESSLDSAVDRIIGTDIENPVGTVVASGGDAGSDEFEDLSHELQSASLVFDEDSVDVREFVVWVGVFLILILLISLSLTSGYGARILCTLSGFAYPCIMSLKTAACCTLSSSKSDEARGELEQWFTYWCIFGLFTVVESVVDPFRYFSLYYVVKFGVELFCYYPQCRGAAVVYDKLLRNVVEGHVGYLTSIEAAATAVSKKLNTQLKFRRARVVYRKVFKSG